MEDDATPEGTPIALRKEALEDDGKFSHLIDANGVRKSLLLDTPSRVDGHEEAEDDPSLTAIAPQIFLRGPWESLKNFRDLGNKVVDAGRRIRLGMVFRSANPGVASPGDVDRLRDLGIKTLVDLRGKDERLATVAAPYHSYYSTKERSFTSVITRVTWSPFQRRAVPTVEDECEGGEAGEKRSHRCRRAVIVPMPLMGWHFMVFGIIGGRVSGSIRGSVSAFLRGDTREAKARMLSNLNRQGLVGLYKLFLRHCQNQIVAILTMFTDASNYPIHVCCNAGKDRTGTICALLLGCCGVSYDDIVEDYAVSNSVRYANDGAFRSHLQESGLGEQFMRAPPHVMQEVLAWVDEEWGSIRQYLMSIGFEEHMQRKVESLLIEDATLDVEVERTM